MNGRQRAYIGGTRVPCRGSGSVAVVYPTTEERLGTVPIAGPEVVAAAVAAARAAFPAWAETPREERAELLRRVADRVRDRTAELAELVTTELGSPLGISRRVHVGLAVSDFAGAAEALDGSEVSEQIGHSVVVREPVGVVGCITPWNFPTAPAGREDRCCSGGRLHRRPGSMPFPRQDLGDAPPFAHTDPRR